MQYKKLTIQEIRKTLEELFYGRKNQVMEDKTIITPSQKPVAKGKVENDFDYLSAFCFYDKKGRRMSIFGKIIGDTLEIVVIPCSKKDKFSRVTARRMYESGTDKSSQTFGVAVSYSMPKHSFMNWCKDNYLRREQLYSTTKKSVLVDRGYSVIKEI